MIVYIAEGSLNKNDVQPKKNRTEVLLPKESVQSDITFESLCNFRSKDFKLALIMAKRDLIVKESYLLQEFLNEYKKFWGIPWMAMGLFTTGRPYDYN